VRNLGQQPTYGDLTLYTTLSPCMMCTGTMLFLGIPRVVIGDRETYPGDVAFLLARGMDVALLDDPDCIALMRRFIAERADVWQRITAGDR
jgi:cytosine deaminase